ncbi:MAG: hypothetical protein E6Q88_08135 [Lysobacteraceae bacterium]|nr:MAG: hypothetical protein E6Q88_08135 [Xanthomonadaceae bacterium]
MNARRRGLLQAGICAPVFVSILWWIEPPVGLLEMLAFAASLGLMHDGLMTAVTGISYWRLWKQPALSTMKLERSIISDMVFLAYLLLPLAAVFAFVFFIDG